jgi:hypothetical protein
VFPVQLTIKFCVRCLYKLAVIRCRIFCLPVCYPKIWRIRFTELQFCLLFCLGVKLGCSHWGRNVGCRCLRIGCWEEYLGLRGTRASPELILDYGAQRARHIRPRCIGTVGARTKCQSIKRGEVTGKWRKLHGEELNDLYSLPIIVWVIKSRRMRWVGHVARIGERRGVE